MLTGIRRRLIAYYLVVIAVIVILMGAFFIWFTNYFFMENLRDNLHNQARLSASLVEEMLARNAPQSEIDDICKSLGQELGVRITLVDADGTVVADSAEDPSQMDNHGTRPEILEALNFRKGVAVRYSVTLDEEMYYLAVPLNAGSLDQYNQVDAVMRLALPLDGINQAISSLIMFIAGALLLASLLSMGVAVFLSQRITGPIEKISKAARSIAGGNFRPDINISGRDELAQLADNIREMGGSLSKKMDQVIWEKSKLETVVTSMSSGIILTDCDLDIELINPAAEELFDLTREEVIGRSFRSAIRYYTLYENLKSVCRDGGIRSLEINLYYPRALVLDVDLLPVYGVKDTIIGALLLFHETTELRSLEKMRSDFVANVSHELRTPLTTVRGYTETILHEKLTSEQLIDFLQIIDKETGRLSSLLDDLLDLAQIENEKGFIQKEPVDLKKMVEDALSRTNSLMSRQNVIVDCFFPDEEIFVPGNHEWLRQALVNVIENSIRHGNSGGSVVISIEVNNDKMTLTVKDNGPGIPEEDLPYVFERFYRVDKARSRKSGGTGLGLSIVKHIMEAHEATYSLKSLPGEGTIFSFTLPLHEPHGNPQ